MGGVNSITAGFMDHTKLTSIEIPETITIIGENAFRLTSLTNVVIPNSVTSIAQSAFREITTPFTITLPNNLTTISASLFYNSTGLTTITMPEYVWRIGSSAFENTRLVHAVVPNNVRQIERTAFANITTLRSISIPSSVTTVEVNVFQNAHEDLRIYAETTSRPAGWNVNFNPLGRPIIWDALANRQPRNLQFSGTQLQWQAPEMTVIGATGTPVVTSIDPEHYLSYFIRRI